MTFRRCMDLFLNRVLWVIIFCSIAFPGYSGFINVSICRPKPNLVFDDCVVREWEASMARAIEIEIAREKQALLLKADIDAANHQLRLAGAQPKFEFPAENSEVLARAQQGYRQANQCGDNDVYTMLFRSTDSSCKAIDFNSGIDVRGVCIRAKRRAHLAQESSLKVDKMIMATDSSKLFEKLITGQKILKKELEDVRAANRACYLEIIPVIKSCEHSFKKLYDNDALFEEYAQSCTLEKLHSDINSYIEYMNSETSPPNILRVGTEHYIDSKNIQVELSQKFHTLSLNIENMRENQQQIQHTKPENYAHVD